MATVNSGHMIKCKKSNRTRQSGWKHVVLKMELVNENLNLQGLMRLKII